jgi:hypothetical protein
MAAAVASPAWSPIPPTALVYPRPAHCSGWRCQVPGLLLRPYLVAGPLDAHPCVRWLCSSCTVRMAWMDLVVVTPLDEDGGW